MSWLDAPCLSSLEQALSCGQARGRLSPRHRPRCLELQSSQQPEEARSIASSILQVTETSPHGIDAHLAT